MVLKRALLLIIAIGFFSISLTAGEIDHKFSAGANGAYYFDDHKGYDQNGGFTPISYNPIPLSGSFIGTAQDQGRDLGNGWGGLELEIFFRHKMKIPFLQGEGALVKDNNLTLSSRLFLTPVSVHLQEELVWTPIAFLQAEAGLALGTGWPLSFIGADGLGLNSDGSGEIDSTDFGVMFQTHGALTFQFDVAALWPGDWHHIVLVAQGKFLYHAYSRANNNQAWIWRADDGENFNGWEFRSTFFLGYQMPIFIDTIGILVETEQKLGSVRTSSMMADGGWGSDHVEVKFAPMVNMDFGKGHSLTVLFQFRVDREYTSESVFYNWFMNRESTGATYVDFYRMALAYTWKF